MSTKDLIDFHNANNPITQSITGDHLPIHLKYIFLPPKAVREAEEKKKQEFKDFERKTRYRCEQVNTSKINGSLVHFCSRIFNMLSKTIIKIINFL
jgi:hypothetical protein